MENTLVMSVIGSDRPGLVEKMASAVKDCGGNWLESRMCHLGGQFAGILRVGLPAAGRAQFEARLSQLESEGLSIVIKDAGEAESEGSCHEVATVHIVGNDRPGIVSEISNAFARRGVNVEELTTECRSAPMSGDILFEARARICIPESCESSALLKDLEALAADLMVDLDFETEA